MGYLLDIARKVSIPQKAVPLYYEKNELNELSSSVVRGCPSTEMRQPKSKENPVQEKTLPSKLSVKELWPPEVQSLVDWFSTLAPPSAPFNLEPHIHVLDPAKFFNALRREIETGPAGPRARTGTLQSDLRKLKAYLN